VRLADWPDAGAAGEGEQPGASSRSSEGAPRRHPAAAARVGVLLQRRTASRVGFQQRRSGGWRPASASSSSKAARVLQLRRWPASSSSKVAGGPRPAAASEVAKRWPAARVQQLEGGRRPASASSSSKAARVGFQRWAAAAGAAIGFGGGGK
jgi:hypothetical protein